MSILSLQPVAEQLIWTRSSGESPGVVLGPCTQVQGRESHAHRDMDPTISLIRRRPRVQVASAPQPPLPQQAVSLTGCTFWCDFCETLEFGSG